jgi:RNA polymerase sigma-70 factor (ECF subfamily)
LSESSEIGAAARAAEVAASTGRAGAKERLWAEHIRGIAAGREQSLADLYDASGALVYSVALRMLRVPADAEEIVVDVYSHVWRCAASWDESRGCASAWLVMLCRSRCIDRLRSRGSREAVETAWSPSDLDRVSSFSDTMAVEQAMVRRALGSLEPAQRQLLELAFFSGMTHEELAARLSLPLGTVKTRIRAAIGRMRNLLRELAT